MTMRRLVRLAAAIACAAALAAPVAARAQAAPTAGDTRRCASIGDPVAQAECIARSDTLRSRR
jgi:hypothetical protein